MSMSRIWTEKGFVDDDPWIFEIDEQTTTSGARIVQSFKTFLEVADSATESGQARDISVEPSDDISLLAPYLHRIDLIAVSFPAFSDGRGFSQASVLRTNLLYNGEVRAIGDVLIDQIPLMLRCGVDSFAVSNPVALRRLAENRLNGIPLHYQPAAQREEKPRAPSYAWRRQTAAIAR